MKIKASNKTIIICLLIFGELNELYW